MGFRVWGLGFRAWGANFKFQGSRFKISDSAAAAATAVQGYTVGKESEAAACSGRCIPTTLLRSTAMSFSLYLEFRA